MIRTKNENLCGIGGLTLWFFDRFNSDRESFSDLSDDQWYLTKLCPPNPKDVSIFILNIFT